MEGTRGELREEIQRWMSGISPRNDPWAQQFQALWLYGPMGVGKSALAQTLGEWAEQNHRLGAAVFLSEEKGRNDPRRLFISVAQQLAQKSDAYAKYIQHQLVQDDSDIRLLPTLNLTRQFRILFLKPFRSGIRFPQKLVVIVDGLDEFGGKADQDEIVQLLSGSIDTEPLTERSDLPLQWILCSRPEPHIRRILGGINIRCWKKLVPMGEEDVRFFFEKELEDIRQQNSLELDWLPRSSLDKMVRAAAGLFIYASTLVRFIRDGDRGSEKELQIVLEYIDRKTTENPLVALDELYVAVLSNTPVRRSGPSEPPPISSETHQLLGSVIFYPQLPILELANLLDLYKTGFDKALESLHAVVSVPPVDRAALDHLQFYHTSFSDFLCDPSRSNDFVLRQDEIHATFIKACFRALGQTQLRLARGLSWRTHKPNVLTVAHRVQSYAAKHVWTMCINVENPSRDLLDTIVDFDFQQLVFVKDKIPPSSFQAFAQWLLKQVCAFGT
jgi:hypothetical protein